MLMYSVVEQYTKIPVQTFSLKTKKASEFKFFMDYGIILSI